MSRFSDYDDWDEDFPNQAEFWYANTRRALKGKRGRKALAELREALMALPEHKLIEGAVCTVGAEHRRTAYGDNGWCDWRERFDKQVEKQGEGVCAIGAFRWYRKVKEGADPAEAFASLPTVFGTDEGNSLTETADLGKDAGLAFVLAYDLAYRNDEVYKKVTPEERHAAFIAWIDQELADVA